MIRLLAMDVDGTLTDGGVYMDGSGNEWKRFDIQDGMGISRFRAAGGLIALISGRFSPATERRAKDLHVDFLANGVGEKLSVLCKISAQAGLKAEEVAYVGDDVNDIACASWAGLGVAVSNAVPELKAAVQYVTSRSGGHGAIREVSDMILLKNAEEVQ